MKKDDISSKPLKRFRQYILNKEKAVGQGSMSKKQGAVHRRNLKLVLKLHLIDIAPKRGPSSSNCDIHKPIVHR